MYRPGSENQVPDAFTRFSASITNNTNDLLYLHEALCHPGVTRLMHFVKSKNLPYSIEDVKLVTSKCKVCCEMKPQFYKPKTEPLIKATHPFERLSIDFKGPVPSITNNKYILTIIDEYSRYPFAFPCFDLSSTTVIKCLCQVFALFGTPQYIHSDRGMSFMSAEIKTFPHSRGIATSRSTPYNPTGNGQVERLNGTLWKAITLALKTRHLNVNQWEIVLLDVLHSLRSLLCTETNETPHDRIFSFNRRSAYGSSLPSWLLHPGPVFLKRNVRQSKYDPLVDEVELIEANPKYAHIKHPDGRESTVSLKQLAPVGEMTSNLIDGNSDKPGGLDVQVDSGMNKNVAESSKCSVQPDEKTKNTVLDAAPTPNEMTSDNSKVNDNNEINGTKEPNIKAARYNLRSGYK